uniref:Uncharacterized protein n=1 Tax=Plectus sambesii TaxID=2011161 RepID=A0A914XKI8_9BILA
MGGRDGDETGGLPPNSPRPPRMRTALKTVVTARQRKDAKRSRRVRQIRAAERTEALAFPLPPPVKVQVHFITKCYSVIECSRLALQTSAP